MAKKYGIKFFFLLAILLVGQSHIFFSQEKDDVLGIWYNEEKTSKFEIYLAKNGKYYGVVKWLKVPLDSTTNKPRTDKFNPDEDLKKEPLIGIKVLKGFVFNKPGVWNDGTIYDPKTGKTYSSIIKMEKGNKNKLFVKGYIGLSFIGKTTTWERTTLD